MKIAGVICEYNPFHNGHKFQIEETKKQTSCDAIVALMSGNYVQRGDISIFDKFTRAKCAILGGADLVLELPTAFSMQSAEFFAKNAVYILNSLNAVDYLTFGAETDNLNQIYEIASLLANETSEFKNTISENLKGGNTFAKARALAIGEVLGESSKEILSQPNNILAVEYIKSLIRLNSKIEPILIKRKNAQHDSFNSKDSFASATYIRNLINHGETEKALEFIPQNCHDIIINSKPVFISEFAKAIMCELYKISIEDLRNIADITEGLENRIKREAETVNNLSELISKVKTKRYTESRIRRILLNTMLGISKEIQHETLKYIRVLDFNETGRKILNLAKKSSDLPIIKNTSQVKKINSENIKKQWFRELMFDKIYLSTF